MKEESIQSERAENVPKSKGAKLVRNASIEFPSIWFLSRTLSLEGK